MVRVLALATMQWETLVQLGKKKCTINVVIAIFFFSSTFQKKKRAFLNLLQYFQTIPLVYQNLQQWNSYLLYEQDHKRSPLDELTLVQLTKQQMTTVTY